MNVDEIVKSVIGQSGRLRSDLVGSPPLIFLPREGKNAPPRGMPVSLALPQPTLLTLPPYFLLSLPLP